MYTNALWGTRARRAHLISTKYFKCDCKRCADPTELGTNFSTIICNVSFECLIFMPILCLYSLNKMSNGSLKANRL